MCFFVFVLFFLSFFLLTAHRQSILFLFFGETDKIRSPRSSIYFFSVRTYLYRCLLAHHLAGTENVCLHSCTVFGWVYNGLFVSEVLVQFSLCVIF